MTEWIELEEFCGTPIIGRVVTIIHADFKPPVWHVGFVRIATTITVPGHATWWGMGTLATWLPGTESEMPKSINAMGGSAQS